MVGGRVRLRPGRMGDMSLWAEIHSQAEVLGRLAESQIEPTKAEIPAGCRAEEFSYVVMAARGSSDNAARYAQYLWGARNRLNVALAAPSLYGPYRQPSRICAMPWWPGSPSRVSRPTCWQCWRKARARVGRRLRSPTRWNHPMARLADRHLDLAAGPELAVAATKSYTTQLLAIGSLSAALADDAGMTEALQLWVRR